MTARTARPAMAARDERFAQLAREPFDVVVVGGGITGAGIARDATLAGLKVALFEAQDFAAGTSSRSTKIFHGGLRYLEHGEIGLVRTSGREREWMARRGPHLVRSLPMLLPVYRGMRYGPALMSLAVFVYDWLAGVRPEERRRSLDPAGVREVEPSLTAEGLTGGVLYHEYLTDDARATVTVLRAGLGGGALALNYAPVVGFLREGKRIAGVRVADALDGGRPPVEVRATLVVNATGPWAEEVLRLAGEGAEEPRLLHSRGIHVVVPRGRLPVSVGLSLPSPDQRLVFVLPRGDVTYVGTTDAVYAGDLRHPPVPAGEVMYLLDVVHRFLPQADVRPEDVVGAWSGVRPLIRQPGRAVKDVSRRDEIWVGDSGLISIAGGKLTAWREMAEEVVRTLYRSWPRDQRWPGVDFAQYRRRSLDTPLPGAEGAGEADIETLMRAYGLEETWARHLAERYGGEARDVAALAGLDEDGLRPVAPGVRLLRGEVRYLVEREMAVHLTDLVIRRTGLGWFGRAELEPHLHALAVEMGKHLGWDPGRLEAEVADCRREAYWEELPAMRAVEGGGGGR
jgi:glycerol-3-phosphate dehydrogenase